VDRLDVDVPAIAVLDDPVRRALYRHVVAQAEPVGRDAAGAAVGVSRSLAAFHLDKLAAAGLLDVEFRRPAGRGGPGAGRPAKLYRRAERQLDVTLPPRHYELAARILAAAVHDAADGRPLTESLRDAARRAGAAMADGVRDRQRAVDVLAAFGYEPVSDGTRLVLRNCPFHALAVEHTDLVCGVNTDLLAAFTDSVPELGLTAALDPAPGRCCVTLTKSTRRS
jgi:predicted ArsR family transcriptional regulator